MTPQNIFKTISERLQTAATVKTVYGDPVVAEGKTIIPVARVRFGFGAGFGQGDTGGEGVSGNAEADKGGGGGGGAGGQQFTNISQLFGTIDDRLVGETPAQIGLGIVGVSRGN